jgi:hypothetical protein
MNAPTGKITGIAELDVQLTNFYKLRSDLLDIFADIERILLTYISKTKEKNFCTTAPLGQKIEAAKRVPADSLRSNKLKAKADEELSKLAELLPLRADIVHSRMELAVTTSSQFLAIFRNIKDATVNHPEALVFDYIDFEKFVHGVRDLETSLSEALTAQNPQPKAKASNIE